MILKKYPRMPNLSIILKSPLTVERKTWQIYDLAWLADQEHLRINLAWFNILICMLD